MGKIFGISDLPVSTIMSAFEPVEVPKPKETNLSPIDINRISSANKADVFVSKKSAKVKSIKAFMKRLFIK